MVQNMVLIDAIDVTNSSIVGYGCNSIWNNNPSIAGRSFSTIDEYVAFYRSTLADAYIAEMIASNPSYFSGKNIS